MVNSSVSAVVFNREKNQILVVKRRDAPIWILPGGGVDPGERPEEAAIREVKEETGIDVVITRLVAVYTPINRLTYLTYLFECAPISDTLSTSNETKQVGFFDVKKLPTPFFFIHEDWIRDVQQQLPTTINKPLSQVTYFRVFQYFFKHPLILFRFLLSCIGLPINSK